MSPQQRNRGFCAFDAGSRRVPLSFRYTIICSKSDGEAQGVGGETEGSGFLMGGGNAPAIDLRFLLLRAGDVERNPGPGCFSCEKTLSASPLSCEEESCDRKVHRQRKCSGVRRGEVWRCPDHRIAGSEERFCDKCKKKLAEKKAGERGPRTCVAEGCRSVCHRGRKCSNISRYSMVGAVWTCREHRGEPSSPENEQHEAGVRAEKKVKCGGCKATVRKDIQPIVCDHCEASFHGKCTDLSRDVLDKIKGDADVYRWTCQTCQRKIEQQEERERKLSFEEEVDEVSAEANSTSKQTLRVLQWNAEAVSTKVTELAARLTEEDIDVCVIQESHLQEGRKVPFIDGYKPVRADRIAAKHGGLLAYVKKSLVMEEIGKVAIEATEVSTFRIRMSRNKWVHISNVYIPPENSKGQDSIRLRTDAIPALGSSLICGDFNAHSILWDNHVACDARGEELVDWIFDNNLSILNDGDPTRINRTTGNVSTPDVTMCGSDWLGKVEWCVADPIGSSDHLPIVITINGDVKHQSVYGKRAKWKDKGVKWSLYREDMEERVDGLEELSLLDRIAKFTAVMVEAGKKNVGKVKPGKRTRVYLTPEVREKIKTRNSVRRRMREKKEMKETRRQWLAACKEVNEAIQEAKEENWREVVEGAVEGGDERKVWNFVKQLSGSPDNQSPNEVLVHQGRRITSQKKKADCFLGHYAGVSKLSFSREEKELNRNCRRMLKHVSVDGESCGEFTMKQLDRALAKMKRKGAPGPDDIPPSFLKELGPKAKAVLLRIYNESFRLAECPQIWRSAIIIPLLKAGKPSGAIKSYRPVSLTSCMVKVLERLIAERIYEIMETSGSFSKLQAGFRRGRSCADQILKITQAIENGFNQKKMERSVLVLLDYSSAYDTVWRQKLLLSMNELGIPKQLIRWVAAFLNDRQAKVRFGDSTSRTRQMRQGLPQGSVLSPLLFIIYINNLATILPDKDTNCMFADDVGILVTRRSKAEAEKAAQEVVDVVVRWSREWKLTLNSSKSEVSCFTTSTQEVNKWKPTIKIDGESIPFAKNPRLLGVYLDCQLSFGYHVRYVTREAAKKLRLIAMVSNTTWGWKREDLKKLYSSLARGKLDYAAEGWQPWLSDSNICALDRIQNKAIRLITGQMKSSPVDALRLESGIPPYSAHVERMCLRSAEKAIRMPEDHPLRETATNAVPAKGSRRSWKAQTDRLIARVPEPARNRKPTRWFVRPPWKEPADIEVYDAVPGIEGRDDELEVKKAAAERQLDSHNADYVLYTDGSAEAGFRDGGSGVVVTRGVAASPIVIENIRGKGASRTSSFEEEVEAAKLAVRWICEQSGADRSTVITIATDSQSMCKALRAHGDGMDELWNEMDGLPCKVIFQWIPGHSDICGNELADAEAKGAAQMDGDQRAVSFNAIKADIKNLVQAKPPEHQRSIQVYSRLQKAKEETMKTRKDQTEIARLRSGHHLGLNETRSRYNPDREAACERCGYERDDLEHWLACDGTMAARMKLFGETTVELSALTNEPQKSLALARETFRGAGRPAARR